MRLAVPALALAALLSACAKDPAHEEGNGGAPGSGGTPASGGKPASTGGVTATGGKVGTGGTPASGGSSAATTSSPPAAVDCPDISTVSAVANQAYSANSIAVDNNPNKNYYFQANWWNKYNQQVETINGLGFSVSNPAGASSSDNNPLGFPSIYIGSYQGRATKGSNLPKQVSALTSVPTIFRTNGTSIDNSNLNATYDVWFSQSSGGVSGTNPGGGGAYLMVWLWKPSKRQPRGSIALSGATVGNVPGAWTVWYDNTNPPCVSYVSSQPIAELQFDLNDFIQHAVKYQWGVTNSQYLSIVFGGTEIWGGGDGFQIKQFCANVK